ncbi:MAG: hypothetical protein ACREJR_01285 [Candidatus Rokuibacteriota bacterium]
MSPRAPLMPSAALSLDDVVRGVRLLRDVPALVRHPVRLVEARGILSRRFARREADLLALIRCATESADGPYARLMRAAGLEYGDAERLVQDEGVEGALAVLLRHGVYLTVTEFKGRRPVVRGSVSFELTTDALRNPRLASHYLGQTSGSRGQRTAVPMSLPFIRDRAVNNVTFLSARNGLTWQQAHWEIPGGTALGRMLWLAAQGAAPVRWFSPIDPAAPDLTARYRWSTRLARWAARAAGVRLRPPEHVPLDDPRPIIAWMQSVLRQGGVPHLWTYTSAGVRLAQAAHAAGIDLTGAELAVLGEPITAARLETIRRAGARALPHYGISEAGPIGFGCLAPASADEVHVFHDVNAVISAGADAPPGLVPGMLLVTSLRETAPFVLLNVSFGDAGVVSERRCGCALEPIGWRWHLDRIHSQEKLTAGGMTFLDTDVMRVLDEVLPARFGGGPTDYQLQEESDAAGRPRLALVVHPRVGPVDEAAIARALLDGIGVPGAAERVMALAWQSAGLIHVRRDRPRTTPSGKILHLHAPGG